MPPVRWPAEAIWQAVVPLWPHFSVEIVPTLDSTNSELMRRARAGRDEAIALVAEQQTAGRGRLGRDWLSPSDSTHSSPACLTFSLGLPLAVADWSGLSLAVGLSLAHSLHPAIQLKWPNDLYYQGRKLGGILVETAPSTQGRYLVVGVGLNLRAPPTDGLRTPPAALTELLPGLDAPQALQQVLPPLVWALQRFAEQGFAPLQAAYQQRDALAGCAVECSDGLQGTAQGVDARGALLVHTPSGVQTITSAEVSVRPAIPPSLP